MRTLNGLESQSVSGGFVLREQASQNRPGAQDNNFYNPPQAGSWSEMSDGSPVTSGRQGTYTANACTTITTGNVSSQTCVNSDGTTTTQTCLNTGVGATIGGKGGQVTANGCFTITR